TENEKTNRSARPRPRIGLWIGVLIVLAAIVGAIMVITGSQEKPSFLSSRTGGILASPDDWSKGAEDSPVVLIEYSDFQCPACASYYPSLKLLTEEFGDRIRFVYRHFPLEQHVHAVPTARAAEAAGEQGKFWEMHDLLFENQRDWANKETAVDAFFQYAVDLGLDPVRFRKDFESPETGQAVEDDLNSGLGANVPGTPTFFLNGLQIENPKSHQEFRDVLRAALG
ncbi:MAG TPA: thioredoxin domain-containing protein, partial [Nitrospiria bacterium]|nr:thioredoxin domain-containing protein [Nitrospiria bacterium]